MLSSVQISEFVCVWGVCVGVGVCVCVCTYKSSPKQNNLTAALLKKKISNYKIRSQTTKFNTCERMPESLNHLISILRSWGTQPALPVHRGQIKEISIIIPSQVPFSTQFMFIFFPDGGGQHFSPWPTPLN